MFRDTRPRDVLAWLYRLAENRASRPGQISGKFKRISAKRIDKGSGSVGRPFNPNATEEDIYYCFRLILGRNPHPHEWPGHSARAGSELAAIVRSYLGSQEFNARGLLALEVPRDICSAQFADFRIYASQADTLIGRAVLQADYEPDVTAVFRRYLRSGMGVIDIGANIGYFTLLSAAAVGPSGYVLAVEPNPHNVRLLEASRRVNGFNWITVMLSAAGRRMGVLALRAGDSNGSTVPIDGGIESLNSANLVPCIEVDRIVDDRRIDLIKVDVEGAEAAALEGARRTLQRWKPLVISEFSPEAIPGISGVSAEDYLRFLTSLGYCLGTIEPNGSVSHHGQDIHAVIETYQSRGTDHINIVASCALPS